jgi:hypothetical protein
MRYLAENHHMPWLVHNDKFPRHTYLHHCYQTTHKSSGTVEQIFMKYIWALYSLSRHLNFCENRTVLVILHDTVQVFLHESSVSCTGYLLECMYFT